MFEKIVLRSSEKGTPISLGALAQALLFYQRVHLVLDFQSLRHLLEQISIDELLELLARGNLRATLSAEATGLHTQKSGVHEFHRPITYYLSSEANVPKIQALRDRITELLIAKRYSRKQSQALTEKIITKAPVKSLQGNDFVQGGIVRAIQQEFLDGDYVREVVRNMLSRTVGAPDMSNTLKFDVYQAGEEFVASSNINFAEINSSRKRIDPNLPEITNSTFLGQIVSGITDIHIASHYGSELLTSTETSNIIKLKYEMILRRGGISKEQIETFHEVVLPDAPALADIIDSGEKSFSEFLKVLDKSQKFRDWIQKVGPDEKLAAAYLRDVTAEGWIGSIPGKILRYFITSIGGLVASEPTGLALGAADTFLVDKVFSGWRPNHFINKTYKPLLDQSKR